MPDFNEKCLISNSQISLFNTTVSKIILSACLVFSFSTFTFASSPVPRQKKKVIEYGWDWPYLSQVANAKHLAQMEKLPFDGVAFRIKDHYSAFSLKPWEKKDFPAKKLQSINWNKFTDNFISIQPRAPKNFNWYNDTQWKIIDRNLRLYSKAVQLSDCVGVVFDPEATYGNGPSGGWEYSAEAFDGKSYAQVSEQLRKRGRQFIEALQSHKPDLVLFTLFMSFKSSPKARYALYVPFLKGAMEAAGPKVEFIDGNEHSYYMTTARSYEKDYQYMRKHYLREFSPELRHSIRGRKHIAMAIYMDQILSMRNPNTKWRPPISQYLTQKQRLKLFGYQMYQALSHTDKYVWVYGEKMKWWTGGKHWKHMMAARGLGKDIKDWNARQIPDGVLKVMRGAIKRYKTGQPPKYNGVKLIDEAKKLKAQAQKNNKHKD